MRVTRFSVALLALLASCDFAPHYQAPRYALPNGWKGSGFMDDARPSMPDITMRWWEIWHDDKLNALENRMLEQNPSLKEAAERVTQARDLAKESESRLYPQLSGSGGMSKNKASLGRLYFSRSSHSLEYESSESYGGAASWEPDFWDMIRNETRMYKNLAQASAADYALSRLLLESEVADTYIALRGLDAQIAVYEDSIKYFQAAVEITRLRQGGSIGAGLDVSRAENQLYSAQAAQQKMIGQRQVLEHSLAVLVNDLPQKFGVEPDKSPHLKLRYVQVAPKIPSELLERRPDIAMAERRMEATCHAIGVSRAAFFPHIYFTATGGFLDGGFDLARMSNAFWTIAVQAAEPLFTGGLRRAALQRSKSQYRESLDRYRSVVLNAFADVEDGLSEAHYYRGEELRLTQAVQAALRAQGMTLALYTGGVSNYLDALVAQQDALSARLLEVRAKTRQLQATVRLIRALGGGWDAKRLPTVKQVDPFAVLDYGRIDEPRSLEDVPQNR